MPARNKSAPLSRPLPPFGKYYSANNDLPGARPSVRDTIVIFNLFISRLYWGLLRICDYIFSLYQIQTASTTDPAKTRFHRPQHLKVVRETIPPTDADLSGLSSAGQV